MYDNFFIRAKRTVYKWWCVVYKPVYKLVHHGYWPNEKEPYVKYAEPSADTVQQTDAGQPANAEQPAESSAMADRILGTNRQSQSNIDNIIQGAKLQEPAACAPEPKEEEIPAGVDEDVLARANEIMARLNREAAEDEAKKQQEIDRAKEQASEQQRLAQILKANERNIDVFIQEGLSKQKNDNP